MNAQQRRAARRDWARAAGYPVSIPMEVVSPEQEHVLELAARIERGIRLRTVAAVSVGIVGGAIIVATLMTILKVLL